MASLETLQTRLEALDVAIASGVLTVKHGDTQTTFHSMEGLLKARAEIARQINGLNGSRRIRYAYQADKGL